MKINKDNLIGAFVMLLLLAAIGWGFTTTTKVNRVAQAHDNLVSVLTPVLQSLQQQAQMQRPQAPRPPASSAMPAKVPAPEQKPEAK